jgi:hypothetical protein
MARTARTAARAWRSHASCHPTSVTMRASPRSDCSGSPPHVSRSSPTAATSQIAAGWLPRARSPAARAPHTTFAMTA